MTAFDSADGLALRRAVCAAPDDDLPRLVFADYLDEQGDAADADRAAFIRAQCEQGGVPWMSKRWREIDRTAEGLRAKHRKAWPASVARLGVMLPHWRRGFIESVQVHAKRFTRESGRRLLDSEPVREIRLINLRAAGGLGVAEFVNHRIVSRLRGLDFGTTELEGHEVEAVAAAGWGTLAGLQALTLRWAVGADGARGLPRLLRSLPRLTTLAPEFRYPSRDSSQQSAALAGAVAAASGEPAFARLENLTLSGAAARAVITLGHSPHLGGLKRLHLSDCEVTPEAVADLARAQSLTALEVLDLSGNESLTDADVRSLAGAAFAPTLKVLVVRRCGLVRANAKRFAGLFPHAEVAV